MNPFYDVVAVEGLSVLRDLNAIPKEIERAAVQAVNRTAERSTTDARRRIREEVAFAARYLTETGANGQQRLGITEKAREGSLQAVITGRQRPTSLARFTVGGRVGGRTGVKLQVNPGTTTASRRMFLIRLRAGTADIDTKSNLGLAIRLRKGEKVDNKLRMVPVGNTGLYLLYGPSVDQIFRTVRADISPDAADNLEREFVRLLDLRGLSV